ncbi:polymer-forming cytoskeletal protein [Sinomicrobium kalidii]|uniref:bactofilin family protein n=1 Tax=Sinomicrobium kalidii TaxID=2900738 RepID=UPI001E478DD0|nr:polymer-forming cytoskeletal protein [Sinomicrobium kalidii]UGU17837.1 polymer-forming cytoskeletal protein [Sinomicrobium kalidii]
MFSESKKGKVISETFPQANRIEKNTRITGDIVSDADIRIDGQVEGNVKSSGRIVIGKDGFINGKIECTNADVEGKFTGELLVAEQLSLKSSAIIQGEVVASKLAVDPGAAFNANCTMKGAEIKPLNKTQYQEQKKADRTA